jgi:hypothetical protein
MIRSNDGGVYMEESDQLQTATKKKTACGGSSATKVSVSQKVS